jgi:hypothetical protein
MKARLIPWLAAQQDLSGWLYWYTNWGFRHSPPALDPTTKVVVPLGSLNHSSGQSSYDPAVHYGVRVASEDGNLMYAGENGPLSSQRLELLRMGWDDRVLLALLDPARRRDLASVLVRSANNFTFDHALLERMRREAARAIGVRQCAAKLDDSSGTHVRPLRQARVSQTLYNGGEAAIDHDHIVVVVGAMDSRIMVLKSDDHSGAEAGVAAAAATTAFEHEAAPPSKVVEAWSPLTAADTASTASPGLLPLPPMGWMSWLRFLCETDCAAHPKACINDDLYRSTAEALVREGFAAAGYTGVHIDDCWAAKARDPVTKRMVADPARFPAGIKSIADYMGARNLSLGLYSDQGATTCGGYPGSEGFEALDAATFRAWGVSYLKLDGCNALQGVPGTQYPCCPGMPCYAEYAKGYPAMGEALHSHAGSRDIVYACSWPAYLGDHEDTKPWEAIIAAGCNIWRSWTGQSKDYL